MNIHEQIKIAKIDNLLLGAVEPEHRPKLRIGEMPGDPGDFWFIDDSLWTAHGGSNSVKKLDDTLHVFAKTYQWGRSWCDHHMMPYLGRVKIVTEPNQIRGYPRTKQFIYVLSGRTLELAPTLTRWLMVERLTQTLELDARDPYEELADLESVKRRITNG